jgi:hypothetical protein
MRFALLFVASIRAMLINDILGDMSDHFGTGEYLPDFQDKLTQCMAKWDDTNLTAAQNAAW